MKEPPRWSEKQLAREAEKARARFRRDRLGEPLETWIETFDRYKEQFERLFDEYGVADPSKLDHRKLARIFRENLGDALRYLAGPPISADDLKVLAETSLAAGRIAADPEGAGRILETILQIVDPRRFPWIAEERPPRRGEKNTAIIASAALITAQRVATIRRNESKQAQEEAVKRYLIRMGFREVEAREVRTLTDAPEPGEFCSEAKVGSRKADVPVRLYDGRLMPVECKVSNSSTNSVKRLNNDAAVKAVTWHREFGTNQVVPAAVLSGVYKVRNLVQAQDAGLMLFWAHRLRDMRKYIEAAR